MKILTGKVISNKMDKTVIVLAKKLVKHNFYKKTFFKTVKYYAHDEFNLCEINDLVEIVKTKPISKKKFWVVSRFIVDDTCRK